MSEKPKRRRRSRRRKDKKLQKSAMRVGILLIGIPLLALLGFYFYNRSIAPSQQELVQQESANAVKKTFEQILNSQDEEELLYELAKINTDAKLALPIRIDNLNKKIAIAEALINLNGSEESVRSASKSKLFSMIETIRIKLQNDFASNELAELAFFTETLNSSKDQELNQLGGLAAFVNNLARFLGSEPASDAQNLYLTKTNTALDELAADQENVETISTVYDFVKLATLKTTEGELTTMRKFVDKFSASQNSEIAAMANELEGTWEGRQFAYGDDAEKAEAMIATLQSSVQSGVALNEAQAIRWLKRANQLLSKNQPDAAARLVGLVNSGVKNAKLSDHFELKFDTLNSRLGVLGERFTPAGFVSPEGTAADFASDDEPVKRIVLVVSKPTIQKSKSLLLEIRDTYNQTLLSPNYRVIMAIALPPDSHEELEEFQRIETQLKYVEVFLLDESSSQYESMVNMFRIHKLPFLFVLDGDIIKSIQPEVRTIESVLLNK